MKTNILIVEARFYEDIAEAMFEGAKRALSKEGMEFERISVPGALEIPAAIRFAALSKTPYDGYVALGCVIRGETTHYDLVAGESARGLMDLSLRHGLAIGNGILTVENDEQAWVRARWNKKDKGGDAARACMEMVKLKRHWSVL